MKLQKLYLSAFGPFTERTLDLSAGREGLHIIFGVNEAGKVIAGTPAQFGLGAAPAGHDAGTGDWRGGLVLLALGGIAPVGGGRFCGQNGCAA